MLLYNMKLIWKILLFPYTLYKRIQHENEEIRAIVTARQQELENIKHRLEQLEKREIPKQPEN